MLPAERTVFFRRERCPGFKPALMRHLRRPIRALMLGDVRAHDRDGILRDLFYRCVQRLPESFGFRWHRQAERFACRLDFFRAACSFDFHILGGDKRIDVIALRQGDKVRRAHAGRAGTLDNAVKLRFKQPDLGVVLPVCIVELDDAADKAHAFRAHDKSVLLF